MTNVLEEHVLKRDGNLGAESIIWKREHSKGFFRKQVTSIDILTNYRVLVYNVISEYVSSQLALEDIDDVVIMNQNRQSSSNLGMTTMSGNRYAHYGYGSSKSISTLIGDLVFMDDGKLIIIFKQIADASSVLKSVVCRSNY